MSLASVKKTHVTRREPTLPERLALAGTANVSAACVTTPMDLVKIRMQMTAVGKSGVETPNIVTTARRILAHEGVRGFYKGLTASAMREGSYSTLRLGLYEPVKRLLGATDPSTTPLYLKVASGALTGCVGASFAVPTDLVKVRMQNCDATPPRYASAFQAFGEIFQNEGGLRGLYRGLVPTVQRGALLTATQVPAYDHSKHFLLNNGLLQEGTLLHFTCCMFAGVVTAAVTNPVDVVKTRMMATAAAGGASSAWGALLDIGRREGPRGYCKGFTPSWMRIGPHTTVALMIFEQLRAALGMRPV